MKYKFKKPEVKNFKEFTEEFIPAFDQVDETARQKALSINVWAYPTPSPSPSPSPSPGGLGPICHPTGGVSPWGAIYSTPNPTCNPT